MTAVTGDRGNKKKVLPVGCCAEGAQASRSPPAGRPTASLLAGLPALWPVRRLAGRLGGWLAGRPSGWAAGRPGGQATGDRRVTSHPLHPPLPPP